MKANWPPPVPGRRRSAPRPAKSSTRTPKPSASRWKTSSSVKLADAEKTIAATRADARWATSAASPRMRPRAIVQRLTGVQPDGPVGQQRRRRLVEGIRSDVRRTGILGRRWLRHPDGRVRLCRHPPHGADRARSSRASASRPNSTTPAASRKRPPSCSREYKARHASAEREAQDIVTAAKAEAERIAAEAKTKMEDFVARRTKTAESKIALAEAQAIADVRSAAANAAVAAASSILSQIGQGPGRR